MKNDHLKKKTDAFTADYRIGGVHYLVSSRFVPPTGRKGKTMGSCLRHCISSGLVALTEDLSDHTMKAEYMCPAAGKED